MDPDLYSKCEEDYEQTCLEKQHHDQERQERWAILQKAANSHGMTNHVDTVETPETQMQIESTVSVPEKIDEEPEKTTDESMVVDEPVAAPT
jgi:hypothetical protein